MTKSSANIPSGFINNDGDVMSSDWLKGGTVAIADIWFDEDRGISTTTSWMAWSESYAWM